jgi:hypothetical protein
MVQAASNSGVTLSIQSNQGTMAADAKKTDDQLKKLLQACMSGNMEAITAALILLDKRNSLALIKIGTQAVKVQMERQKFTSAVQKSLAGIKGTDAGDGAKISLANAKLSESSLISQSVNSLVQTTLSEKEAGANFAHGWIQKLGQIYSSISRMG